MKHNLWGMFTCFAQGKGICSINVNNVALPLHYKKAKRHHFKIVGFPCKIVHNAATANRDRGERRVVLRG
jgi:hypothetical protein